MSQTPVKPVVAAYCPECRWLSFVVSFWPDDSQAAHDDHSKVLQVYCAATVRGLVDR